MGYKIALTELAAGDLDSITKYIAGRLANPPAAAAFLDAVAECFGNLEAMPLMYERCRSARLRSMGYRRAVIKNYVMIYRVTEPKKTVYVLRFFYGARDYEKLL